MNQYGFPLLTRKSDIASKVAESTIQYPLEVMGKYQPLKQIRVRIGLPVYRITNGRTRTFQREYLVTHPDVASDLFTKDPDSLEAQRAQHQILQRLAEDEDLLKEFQSGTQQTEPIIVTNTGVVVNGNRRLCVWRNLFTRDPVNYKHFEFIDVAVLPDDCDEEEIRALEKRLQIQRSHRAEYKWHNKAAMMKEEREAGVTLENLAKSYDTTRKEVETLIGALEYAEIYLQKIGKPEQWSLVDKDEFAFRPMVEERKKISDQGRKELFETICFTLIKQKDSQGRLYTAIPDVAEYLDSIALALQDKGILKKTPQPSLFESLDDTMNTSDTDNVDDIDLLGGETTPINEYSELASKIQDSDDIKLGEVVKQVTDEQKSLKSEQKSAKFLLNTLSSISRSLWNVRTSGLNENTITEGVSAHLDTIQEHLLVIKKWLEEHPEQ